MNRISILSLLLLSLTACSDAPKQTAETATQSAAASAAKPYAEPALKQERTIKLAGETLSVSINRQSDASLPVVTDEMNTKFYDNTVSVTVRHASGDVFFQRTFTKTSFSDFLSDAEKSGTVLLGMALDATRSDAHALRLGAQVGQPGIEEGPAFIVEIPLDGSAIGIVRDRQQDTTGEDMDMED